MNPQVTPLPAERNPRVDGVVQAFRAVWAAGERPRIEDFLDKFPEPDKSCGFRELLSVELEQLRQAGSEPEYGDYAARFASYLDLVAEQFDASDSCQLSAESTLSLLNAAADSGDAAEKRRKIEDRYRCIELLGRGGFGEVWKARDQLLGRDVALKTPRRDRTFSQHALTAFIDEARKGSQLRQVCQRVVNVIDIVDEFGFCFIVMELMRGGSLSQRIKAGAVPPAEAARTVAEIAEILARLHSKGYVHRDVKPGNVLFDEDGNPHLADLGLAASEDQLLDEPDDVLGTLLYMPLEQAESRSNRVDGRADIYSLGVIFYRMLTGRLPYRARNRAAYVQRLRDPDGPKPPRQVDSGIPAELERICLRCLETNARDRYQTAADIARDIRRWQRKQANKGWRRNLTLAILAAAALILTAAVVFGSRWIENRRISASSEPPAETPPGAGQNAVVDTPQGPVSTVKELIFPASEQSSWALIDSGKGIHVTSTHLSLLGIAELAEGESCTVELDLHQLDWIGRVGLFVGHRSDDQGNARFQLIQLENWNGDSRWERSICSYSLDDPAISGHELGSQTAGTSHRGRNRGAKTIALVIRDGVVTEIRFCGELLEQLMATPTAQHTADQQCRGFLGLYNLRSSATFSNIRIDGETIQLSKR